MITSPARCACGAFFYMGESIPATISIGGKLPNRLVDEFEKLLDSNSDGFSNTDPRNNPCGSFELTNDQAYNGEFEDLEAFCRKNQLTYVRKSDAKYDFEAEYICWQPGMESPKIIAGSQNSGPVVTLKMLIAAKEDGNTLDEVIADNTPIDVPDFAIVNDDEVPEVASVS